MPEGLISEVPTSPEPEATPAGQSEVINDVPVAPTSEIAPAAEQPVITGVPAEIGGEAVRAETEADQQAQAEVMAKRDEHESFLGASNVTSQTPPQPQQPQGPEIQ